MNVRLCITHHQTITQSRSVMATLLDSRWNKILSRIEDKLL